ncbi:hypothetical protein IWX49DRAFT_594786 [Phyllosticta citricarpa]|uniref:DUF8035 domain-containing protein n=1 Tax=Phyllosticta citricarpa TaxID=55181 RepID=A0ABR1M767_9PEZI
MRCTYHRSGSMGVKTTQKTKLPKLSSLRLSFQRRRRGILKSLSLLYRGRSDSRRAHSSNDSHRLRTHLNNAAGSKRSSSWKRTAKTKFPSIPVLGGHVNYSKKSDSWPLRANCHQHSGSPFSRFSHRKRERAKRLVWRVWDAVEESSADIMAKSEKVRRKPNLKVQEAVKSFSRCTCERRAKALDHIRDLGLSSASRAEGGSSGEEAQEQNGRDGWELEKGPRLRGPHPLQQSKSSATSNPTNEKAVPPRARYTKIARRVFSREALLQAEEPFIETEDGSLVMLRKLGRDEVQMFTALRIGVLPESA